MHCPHWTLRNTRDSNVHTCIYITLSDSDLLGIYQYSSELVYVENLRFVINHDSQSISIHQPNHRCSLNNVNLILSVMENVLFH